MNIGEDFETNQAIMEHLFQGAQGGRIMMLKEEEEVDVRNEVTEESLEDFLKMHESWDKSFGFKAFLSKGDKVDGKLNKLRLKNGTNDFFKGDCYKLKRSIKMCKLLEEFGNEDVEVTIMYPTEYKFQTQLSLIFWYIYKLHADTLVHLISGGFQKWLKQVIRITPGEESELYHQFNSKRGIDLVDDIYMAIASNCEVCRKFRKIAGFGQTKQYGEILHEHKGRRIFFSDIMFLPKCNQSVKGLMGCRMVLVMAIMTKEIVNDITRGRIGARVIKDKEAKTVIKEITDFIDSSYSIPDLIWLDRGTEFINDSLEIYGQQRSIEFNVTGTGASESNGAIERIVGLLRQATRSIAGERGIPMKKVHDFIDLAAERVNANYFISKMGEKWDPIYWSMCPRLAALNELIDLVKRQENEQENQNNEEYKTQGTVLWKPPTLEKDQPAIEVRILGKARLGGHQAYFVEQINNERIQGLNSMVTTHLALRRDLSNPINSISKQLTQAIKEISYRSKGCQNNVETGEGGFQANVTDSDYEPMGDTSMGILRSWEDKPTQTEECNKTIQNNDQQFIINNQEINIMQQGEIYQEIIKEDQPKDDNSELSIKQTDSNNTVEDDRVIGDIGDQKGEEGESLDTIQPINEGVDQNIEGKNENSQSINKSNLYSGQLIDVIKRIQEINDMIKVKGHQMTESQLKRIYTTLDQHKSLLQQYQNLGKINVMRHMGTNRGQINQRMLKIDRWVKTLQTSCLDLLEGIKKKMVINLQYLKVLQRHIIRISPNRSFKKKRKGGKPLEKMETVWEESEEVTGKVQSLKSKFQETLTGKEREVFEKLIKEHANIKHEKKSSKPTILDDLNSRKDVMMMFNRTIRKGNMSGKLVPLNPNSIHSHWLALWDDGSFEGWDSRQKQWFYNNKVKRHIGVKDTTFDHKCYVAKLVGKDFVGKSGRKVVSTVMKCGLKDTWNKLKKKGIKGNQEQIIKGVYVQFGQENNKPIFISSKEDISKSKCIHFDSQIRFSKITKKVMNKKYLGDIYQNTVKMGDWVLYSNNNKDNDNLLYPKDYSGIQLGKVVKIIKEIQQVTYKNVGMTNQQRNVIRRQVLDTPILIIHKTSPISLFKEPVELSRFRNLQHFRYQWSDKSSLGHWEQTLSWEPPNNMSKPICEAIAVSHVMKLHPNEGQSNMLEKGEVDTLWYNTKRGQFLIKRFRCSRRNKRGLGDDIFIDSQGHMKIKTRNQNKITFHNVISLGCLRNLQIKGNTDIKVNPEKENGKLNAQEEYDIDQIIKEIPKEQQRNIMNNLWDDLVTTGVYEDVNGDEELLSNQKHSHGVVRTIIRAKKNKNIQFKEKTYVKKGSVTTESKHGGEWVTKGDYNLMKKGNFPSINSESSYEFLIDGQIRSMILQEATQGKANNENEDDKKGVVGIDKNIVLTGLSPDDPIHKMVKAAKMKEWLSFKKQGVLKPVSKIEFEQARRKDASAACLPMRWVLEWKIIDGEKSIKARLVAQGTVRKDRREGVLTEVALPNHRALYTMLLWQVKQKNWDPKVSILQGDLKTAFLQAENLSEMVFVVKPKDDGATTIEDKELIESMFSKEKIPLARAVMTLYGTRDAPANLDMAVRKSLHQRGFKETLSCPNLYRRFTAKGIKYSTLMTMGEQERTEALNKGRVLDCWVFAYVDDLLMGSGVTSAMEVAKELQERWVFKETPTPPSRFLGIFIKATKEGIFVDQELLASSLKRIISSYIWSKHDTLLLPMPRETDSIEKGHNEDIIKQLTLTGKKHTKYRSLLGILAYLAHTRPDLLFTISYFSQFGSQPTPTTLKHLQIACAYAAKTASYGISFLVDEKIPTMLGDFSRIVPSGGKEQKIYFDQWGKVKPQPPPKKREEDPEQSEYHIEVFVDASYKSGGGKAHSGYLVLINRMVVATKATVQRRKAGSSTRAELLAVMEAMDACLAIKLLLMEIGIQTSEISVVVWCDNDNTVQNINSVNPHATEFHSTFLLRQCYRIIKGGAQLDIMRILFPRFMFLMEGHLHGDEFLLPDAGDGSMGRYRNAEETLKALQAFRKKNGEHEIIGDKDLALYQIIFERMSDSDIKVLHIDGINQLADSMTKMSVSIDLIGRVVHDYKDFLAGTRTAIRDSKENVPYRIKGFKDRYNDKELRKESDDIPTELAAMEDLPEELTAEKFMDILTQEEKDKPDFVKVQKR